MHKYLSDREEVKFDIIFDQKLGKVAGVVSQISSLSTVFFFCN